MATRTSIGAKRERARRNTAESILDVAEQLVQSRGFNAFSYADIANTLGVTKASLHYHFPGKAELGHALLARYARRFADALAEIDRGRLPAPDRLAAYAELYATTLRRRRMCLCGMLAAEFATLPKPINEAVVAFFDDNERWLMSVLEQGRADGTLEFEGPAGDTARMIIGSLEGAMLVTRPYGDVGRFNTTVAALLASLEPQA
ncbi:MAG TPA: TetR/AcrR family transcriptional regulator [Solirubrobacteraceae bacterium]|nr:TetR/AcrR family transcriptional regulator [Solirubrobacteraceae bacterium]